MMFLLGLLDKRNLLDRLLDRTFQILHIDRLGSEVESTMVHGGTNFGFTSGANYDKKHDIQPDLTSYDYDAPISEAGWATPKYYKLRELLTQYADSGQVIPDVPAAYPLIEIPAFTVSEVAPLFDNLPAPQASKEIKPMEQFDQGWGTILYRTTLPA